MIGGCLAPAAIAQVPPQLPGSADPGRLQERLQPALPPRAAPPDIPIDSDRRAPPDQADQVRFTLRAVAVDDATVYDTATLRAVWQDSLGQEVTLAEVYRIADTLTARYRNDGYVLSQVVVPAQRIRDGAVRLRAIEGFVDRVVIEGDADRAGLIRSYAEPVTLARPLRIDILERAVLLMQDLPGITARSVLRPSPDVPGAATLVVHLTQAPVDGFLTLDNRGSRYLGPFQATTGVRLNSPLGLQDQTAIRLISTPDVFHELRAYHITETVPLGEGGTTASVSWSQAVARPGYILNRFDIRSHADSLTFALAHPIVRTRAGNLSFSASFSLNDTRTTLLGGTQLLSDDRIRPLRLGVTYDHADSDGVSLIAFRVSHGLPILGANAPSSGTLSRPDGHTEFTKLNADLLRRQALDGPWALLAQLSGQYSFDRLLAAEEIGLGGAQFLRAYDPSELTGRAGILGRLELQYGGLPDLWWLEGNQLYGYYEAGTVWNRDPVTLADRAQAASDLGLGFRFAVTRAVTGSLEVAKPLTRSVATMPGHGYDPRLFFALAARF